MNPLVSPYLQSVASVPRSRDAAHSESVPWFDGAVHSRQSWSSNLPASPPASAYILPTLFSSHQTQTKGTVASISTSNMNIQGTAGTAYTWCLVLQRFQTLRKSLIMKRQSFQVLRSLISSSMHLYGSMNAIGVLFGAPIPCHATATATHSTFLAPTKPSHSSLSYVHHKAEQTWTTAFLSTTFWARIRACSFTMRWNRSSESSPKPIWMK